MKKKVEPSSLTAKVVFEGPETRKFSGVRGRGVREAVSATVALIIAFSPIWGDWG